MWEQCLASMLVYLGVFLAAMQGVAMIERWLGVSTGHSDTAQQLIGAMMAGNAFAQGAGALATGAAGAAQVSANVASKLPGIAAAGSKLIGNSLAATGGGIKGAIDSAKDQGVKNAAKGGVSNMVNLADVMGKEAVGKAKDYAGGVMDNLDSKAQTGHDAVYEALKNDAATDKPGFESYLNPQPDEYGLNPSGTYGGEPLFPEEDTSGTSTMSGGISDPTLQTEAEGDTFNGVSDPTAGNSSSPSQSPDQPRLDKSSKPNLSDNTPPKPTSSPSPSAAQRLSQSRQQMTVAGQTLNQAGQHMQGQNHIKGAELDESEE